MLPLKMDGPILASRSVFSHRCVAISNLQFGGSWLRLIDGIYTADETGYLVQLYRLTSYQLHHTLVKSRPTDFTLGGDLVLLCSHYVLAIGHPLVT